MTPVTLKAKAPDPPLSVETAKLRIRLAILEDTLRFYAGPESYEPTAEARVVTEGGKIRCGNWPPIEIDRGGRARRALGEDAC